MTEWLLRDLRYGVRQLLRSPGFALAAMLTLALGVGANTIIFSMVNGLLFRPLPVDRPGEVVGLYATERRTGRTRNLSYPEYLDYRDRSGIFAGLVAQQGFPVSLTGPNGAEMVWSELVTENYFSALGLRPSLGRVFQPQDARGPGSDPLVVLSHRAWRDRFGGDPGVIGRVLRLNGHPFTVIGVAPAGYTGVRKFGFHPDVWVPMMMHPQVIPGSEGLLDDRESTWLIVAGRLRAGLGRETASAMLADFAARLEQLRPDTNRDRGTRILPGGSGFDNPDFTPHETLVLSAALAMAAAGLILLLACTNVANLLLARASTRDREVGVRLALGASRGRLVRQFLTEGLLLAVVGGGIGIGLASWTTEIQELMVPRLQFPVGFQVSLDHRVLGFGLVISLLTSLLFGLAPALGAAKHDPVAMLKDSPPAVRPSRWGMDLRSLLVIGQVSLSLVLLVGGGLFLKSLLHARELDVGLGRDHRLLLSLDPGLQGYDSARVDRIYRELLQQIRELPQVTSATLGFPLPLDTYGRSRTVYFEGEGGRAASTEGLEVGTTVAASDYFGTVGTALLHGREFASGDSAGTPKVAVVNQTFAARFGSGAAAVDRHFRLGGPDGERVRIVGVARDARYGMLGEGPRPYLYLPLSQHSRSWLTLVVRTAGDPAAVIPAVRESVRRLDPDLAVFGVMTMQQHLENALNIATSSAIFAGAFGLLALLLAVIGIYGLVSYSVARRTREVGIRMALGASRKDVLRLVLGRGLGLAAIGVGLGLVASLAVGRLLGGMLYEVSPHDPSIVGSMSLLLAAIVLLASYLPARRALRVDPVTSLRSE
jgi:predicted permease